MFTLPFSILEYEKTPIFDLSPTVLDDNPFFNLMDLRFLQKSFIYLSFLESDILKNK